MDETTVLAAATALHSKVRAAVDDQVMVQFGPVKTGAWRDRVLVIGWSTDDTPAYNVVTSPPNGLRDNSAELWQIACVASALDGSSTDAVLNADTKAASLLQVVRDVLNADMRLDGTCGYAHIGPNLDWWHAVTDKGVESTMKFTVIGRAVGGWRR